MLCHLFIKHDCCSIHLWSGKGREGGREQKGAGERDERQVAHRLTHCPLALVRAKVENVGRGKEARRSQCSMETPNGRQKRGTLGGRGNSELSFIGYLMMGGGREGGREGGKEGRREEGGRRKERREGREGERKITLFKLTTLRRPRPADKLRGVRDCWGMHNAGTKTEKEGGAH